MAQFHGQQPVLGTVALVKVPNPHDYGVVTCKKGIIQEFLEKPRKPPKKFCLCPFIPSYPEKVRILLLKRLKSFMPNSKKKSKISMNICVIGAGYVGLVSGTCLAEIGHNVICVDSNEEKIKKLQNNIMSIYEPGLKELVVKNKKAKRLFFTTKIKEGVENSDVIFIAVQTPSKKNGEPDLYYVETVAREVARSMNKYKVIVSKSTMPVKTGKKIKETIKSFRSKNIDFDVASNPEFLSEGSAVDDFLKPDRIIIGVENKKTERVMREIYKPIKAPIIVTTIENAELTKHVCNTFLATKISFINAISNICEKTGGDIEEIARAMGLDKRISPLFLRAGIGYGGSCFPKDVEAFIQIVAQSGYDFKLLKAVQEINQYQKEKFIHKIKDVLWNLRRKEIGVWGLAFKPNTDDIRNAPAIDIINALIKEGAMVKAYDPAATEKAKGVFKEKITYCSNPYDVVRNADALVILTEWDEFKNINLKKVKRLMKLPTIIDGRNIFDSEKIKKLGFNYYSIGRN